MMSVLVIFKTFSYVFEETIGFGVKALFARPAMSHLIKAGDIAKELYITLKGYSVSWDFSWIKNYKRILSFNAFQY